MVFKFTLDRFSAARVFSCLPWLSAGGHGIGKTFHANPYVLHHKNDVNNGIMALGHTFTIEPLICEGTGEARLLALVVAFLHDFLRGEHPTFFLSCARTGQNTTLKVTKSPAFVAVFMPLPQQQAFCSEACPSFGESSSSCRYRDDGYFFAARCLVHQQRAGAF